MATKKVKVQEIKTTAQFGRRMSVEEFLTETKSKNFDVYPRADKPGYYYFATENTLGYVPQELGKKIDYINKHNDDIRAKESRGEELKDNEKLGSLFIAEAKTPGYDEPMFMLCESKRKSLLHFSVD